MNIQINCHLRPGDTPRARMPVGGRGHIELDTATGSVCIYLGSLSAPQAVEYLDRLTAEALKLSRQIQDQPVDVVPTVVSS